MRPPSLLTSSARTCHLNLTRTPRALPLSYFSSRIHMSSGIPSETAQFQKRANMSTSSTASAADYEIQSTPNTEPGVELSAQQEVLVGSVLDLFKGYPTLKKLSLWTDDATFADPLTQAQGRKQYEAQWYGLKAAFSTMEQQSQTVTSAGNPITMNLKTRYVVKGLGSEKVINSKINIFTDEKAERITKVEDRWDGEIPDGPVAKAFRNLNSVVVPAFVGVPKNEEEEAKKGK